MSAGAPRTIALVALVALLLVAACSPGPTPVPGVTPTPVPTAASSASPSADPSATAEPTDGGGAGDVRVVLGIYSGRPDPQWTLSADQAATLDLMIAALPERLALPPSGDLGYHGFTVSRPGSTFVAYLGTVAPPGDGPRLMKIDQARLVERFLLETGRPHLTGAELAEVNRVLAGS